MSAIALAIPRAAELRPARRTVSGGRPYIGPKVQFNVPPDEYDFVLDMMEEYGWTEERYPEALREVFAAGVAALRAARGGE
jgi:hypothetical protein